MVRNKNIVAITITPHYSFEDQIVLKQCWIIKSVINTKIWRTSEVLKVHYKDYRIFLLAAHYMEEYGLTYLNAIHQNVMVSKNEREILRQNGVEVL